jgi:hypothetical protein
MDGRQLFKQYDELNGKTFLDFLKKIHRKFGKLYLFPTRRESTTRRRLCSITLGRIARPSG